MDKESNLTKPETVEPDSGPAVDLATISQLMELARRGDRVAQSEICRQVQGHLTRLADRQLDQALRGKVNPSDIVQATLSRMIHGFVDFRSSSTAEFYAWLNSILNNEIRTTRRDLRRGRRDVRREVSGVANVYSDSITTTEPSPSEIISQVESIDRFRLVMQKLPPDYAQVVQLRGIEELPFREVAHQMNRSVDAVSKLFQRALVALHKELSKFDESTS